MNLIERLQPDLILVSGGDYLKAEPLENGLKPLKMLDPNQQCGVEVFKEYIYKTKPKRGEDPKRKTPYQVELHRFKLKSGKTAYIFYGNSENGWFAAVGYRKQELGCEIKSFWEATT